MIDSLFGSNKKSSVPPPESVTLHPLNHIKITICPDEGLDPARGIMAGRKTIKGVLVPRCVYRSGKLLGLNLMEQAINDQQWADFAARNDLSQLQALNLRGNQLTTVAGLDKMTQLRYLDLSGNNLQTVDLAHAPALEHAFLGGNPNLIEPSPEIVAQGRHAIALHFRDIRKSGISRLFEAKVLVLGAAGCGKTTLVRKLKDGFNTPMPTDADSTHGLEVHDMHFKCHKKNKDGDQMEAHPFTAHLWDFGGQEIYHATHQFFLTNRSLYVIVADGRKEDTDFGYWLQLIELFGGNSPVIVVQNEKSGQSSDLSDKALRKQFPRIQKVHTLDLKNEGAKFKQLKDDIETELGQLSHVGSDWPASRVAVRLELGEMQQKNTPHISLDKYYEICEKHGLEEEDADGLSNYLHELGNILHFKEATLRQTVILDNNWATAGVYAVVDNKGIKEKRGPFTQAEAEAVWRDPNTPGYHHSFQKKSGVLLQLMTEFEVCYELTDAVEKTYLAPQLLPKDRPDNAEEWSAADNLQLHYAYRIMPKGLANRVVVRQHPFVTDYVADAWLSGAIFRRGSALLMLEENRIDKRVYLRASGTGARDLMLLISNTLDRLHDTYQKRNTGVVTVDFVQKMVPCVCEKCKENADPYFFSQEVLDNARNAGVTELECHKYFKKALLSQMLEQVNSTHEHFMDGRESLKMDEATKKLVRDLVVNNDLKEAFDLVEPYAATNNDHRNALIIVKKSWNEWKLKQIQDTQLPGMANPEANAIGVRLLDLLDFL